LQQSDDFIRYVIAHLLAHIYCGHIDDVDYEERQDEFETEAQERVKQWGLCNAMKEDGFFVTIQPASPPDPLS